MTREKAIELIGSMKGDLSDFYDDNDLVALDMAISALSDYDKIQKISLDLAFENDELMNKMNELSADGDCISRQAVIDELNKWDWQELYLPIHFKENIIDVLPPVQPKKEDNTMDIYSDLLRVKHGTMSIDSLIDKVWCRERR